MPDRLNLTHNKAFMLHHGQNINSETSTLTSWVLPLVLIMFFLPDTEPFKGRSIISLALGWVFSEYRMTRSSDDHLNEIKYNYIISWVVFIPHSATLLWLLFASSFANIPTFSNICHFLCDDEVATADHLSYDTNTNTQIHLQKHNYKSTLHKYWYKNRFT